MPSNHNFRLSPAAYTAMAAALIQTHAEAEVIYTDIVPDVVVDVPGTGVEIDLNGDAEIDFNILFTTTNFFNATYWGAFNFYFVNAILASPKNENALAAFSVGGGAYNYPYVIDSGIDVGPSAGMFIQDDYQTLLYQFYAIVSSVFYYPIIQAGEWIFGESDKFLGLALVVEDSTYYGWTRLTVDPSNRAFTIKDLAFETAADTPIETFITPTAITNQSIPEVFISSSAGNLFINCAQVQAFPLTVDIFDSSGKLIMQQVIQTTEYLMQTAQLPAGIYIARISGKEFIHSKQVVLGNF